MKAASLRKRSYAPYWGQPSFPGAPYACLPVTCSQALCSLCTYWWHPFQCPSVPKHLHSLLEGTGPGGSGPGGESHWSPLSSHLPLKSYSEHLTVALTGSLTGKLSWGSTCKLRKWHGWYIPLLGFCVWGQRRLWEAFLYSLIGLHLLKQLLCARLWNNMDRFNLYCHTVRERLLA